MKTGRIRENAGNLAANKLFRCDTILEPLVRMSDSGLLSGDPRFSRFMIKESLGSKRVPECRDYYLERFEQTVNEGYLRRPTYARLGEALGLVDEGLTKAGTHCDARTVKRLNVLRRSVENAIWKSSLKRASLRACLSSVLLVAATIAFQAIKNDAFVACSSRRFSIRIVVQMLFTSLFAMGLASGMLFAKRFNLDPFKAVLWAMIPLILLELKYMAQGNVMRC